MHLPRLKIEFKLLILFIIVAILPLVIDNLIWFTITKTQMTNNASTIIKEAANHAAQLTNEFLTNKLTGLIIHSQTEAVRTKNIPNATIELYNYLKQDTDLEDIILVDNNGKEILHVSQNKIYPLNELGDESSDPAYKLPSFGGGEKYISPVYKNTQGDVQVTLSIPIIVSHNLPNLQTLNTSAIGKFRTNSEISGVLVAKTKLSSLGKLLQNIKIGNTGYIFVVDSLGKLIFHPNKEPLKIYSAFLNSLPNNVSNVQQVNQAKNDKGQQALITYSHILTSQWRIIAQVPVNDVLGSIMQVEIFGVILFLITLVFTVMLSLEFSKNINTPIHALSIGASNFGQGNFAYRVNVESRDELEELAFVFNGMASNLSQSFQKLNADKEIITTEKNKLDFVLFNITDAIIALDKQRNIVIFNSVAEQLTGYAKEETIGKPIGDILTIYENDMEVDINTFAPIYPNDQKSQQEHIKDEIFFKPKAKLCSKRDKKLFIRFSSVILKKHHEHDLGFILTLHDITEELNLEKMKIDFVAIAAHELRTPLTIVKSYLSVFKNENTAQFSKQQNLFLNYIDSGVKQLTSLVENILDVTSIEKGTQAFNFQHIAWAPLVEQTVNDFTAQASTKHIALKFQNPETTINPVLADPIGIKEVIVNLIENAIKYTPNGGEVIVSLEEKDGEVITHIKDTGIGIPQSSLANLFTKFYRVTGEAGPAAKGTGLGLYIAKSIVQSHHGKIWVESTEGKGSIFSFSLPADIANLN